MARGFYPFTVTQHETVWLFQEIVVGSLFNSSFRYNPGRTKTRPRTRVDILFKNLACMLENQRLSRWCY
jgi:hypothetical protein